MKIRLIFFLLCFSLNDVISQDALQLNIPVHSLQGDFVFGLRQGSIDSYKGNPVSMLQVPANCPLPAKEVKQKYMQRQNNKSSEGHEISRYYLKWYAGNGFLTPGSYRVQSSNSVSYIDLNQLSHDTVLQTQGKKGIGGGWRFGAGVGYVLNDFVNIGIDLEYQAGTITTNELNTTLDKLNYDSVSGRMHYSAVSLTPYIIFKALAKPSYFIYNKLGILFTLPFTIKTSGRESVSSATNWNLPDSSTTFRDYNIRQQIFQVNNKLSLGIGFNVAVGVNFRLGGRFRVYGEIFGNFSALSPASGNSLYTLRSNDSSYFFGPLTTSKVISYTSTETRYQNGGPTTTQLISIKPLPDTPDGYQQVSYTYAARSDKFSVNLNSLGLNIGVIYRF